MNAQAQKTIDAAPFVSAIEADVRDVWSDVVGGSPEIVLSGTTVVRRGVDFVKHLTFVPSVYEEIVQGRQDWSGATLAGSAQAALDAAALTASRFRTDGTLEKAAASWVPSDRFAAISEASEGRLVHSKTSVLRYAHCACGSCRGSGSVACAGCFGRGRKPCRYCTNGTKDCSDCMGRGSRTGNDGREHLCHCHRGRVNCIHCRGAALVECEDCRGAGTSGCRTCGTSGTVTLGYGVRIDMSHRTLFENDGELSKEGRTLVREWLPRSSPSDPGEGGVGPEAVLPTKAEPAGTTEAGSAWRIRLRASVVEAVAEGTVGDETLTASAVAFDGIKVRVPGLFAEIATRRYLECLEAEKDGSPSRIFDAMRIGRGSTMLRLALEAECEGFDADASVRRASAEMKGAIPAEGLGLLAGVYRSSLESLAARCAGRGWAVAGAVLAACLAALVLLDLPWAVRFRAGAAFGLPLAVCAALATAWCARSVAWGVGRIGWRREVRSGAPQLGTRTATWSFRAALVASLVVWCLPVLPDVGIRDAAEDLRRETGVPSYRLDRDWIPVPERH